MGRLHNKAVLMSQWVCCTPLGEFNRSTTNLAFDSLTNAGFNTILCDRTPRLLESRHFERRIEGLRDVIPSEQRYDKLEDWAINFEIDFDWNEIDPGRGVLETISDMIMLVCDPSPRTVFWINSLNRRIWRTQQIINRNKPSVLEDLRKHQFKGIFEPDASVFAPPPNSLTIIWDMLLAS